RPRANMQKLIQPVFEGIDGSHHAERIQQGAECEDREQGGNILSMGKTPDSGPHGVAAQNVGGGTADDAHIVMRASVYAVEAESAIHGAGLAWLEERQFATALFQRRGYGDELRSLDAIERAAGGADLMVAHADFEGRGQRRHEIKLPDRADVFAE